MGQRIPLPASRLPAHLLYIWKWFVELSDARRSVSEGGPGAVLHVDVRAWAEATQRFPDPAEVRLLLAIDVAWRAEWHRCFDLKHPKNMSTPHNDPGD